MEVVITCPRCGSGNVKMPPLGMAPEGHAWDGSLVLLTCGDCEHIAPMSAFTVVDGERAT